MSKDSSDFPIVPAGDHVFDGDETREDQFEPDVPPALTEKEWSRLAFERPGFRVSILDDGSLLISDGSLGITARNVEQIAAIIALGNEALRRFDDPRAILEQHVRLQRAAQEQCSVNSSRIAERYYRDDPEESGEAYEGELESRFDEFASDLEALLPPQRDSD